MIESNASTRDGAQGETLSITEAAQRLGISVRTVQRRLDAGTLEAAFEGDTRRVMWRDTTRQNDAPQGDTRHDSDATATTFESDAGRHRDTPKRDSEGDTSHDMTRQLLAEKDARIADLHATVEAQRLQIEAANRASAESAAALREYLKISAKALPGSEYSREADTAPSSDGGGAMKPDSPAPAKASQSSRNGQIARSLRRLLGIR